MGDAINKSDIALQKLTGLTTTELNFGNPYKNIVEGENNTTKQSGAKVAKVIEQVVSAITGFDSTLKEVVSSSSGSQDEKRAALGAVDFSAIAEKFALKLEEKADDMGDDVTTDNNIFSGKSDASLEDVMKGTVDELVDKVKEESDEITITDSTKKKMAAYVTTQSEAVSELMGDVADENITEFNDILISAATAAQNVKNSDRANQIAENNINNTQDDGSIVGSVETLRRCPVNR